MEGSIDMSVRNRIDSSNPNDIDITVGNEKDKLEKDKDGKVDDDDDDDDDDEDFYTPGPEELYNVRVDIAKFAASRASLRLKRQYNEWKTLDSVDNLISRRGYLQKFKDLSLQGTQLLSNRFTSALSYNPKLDLLAAASWNGSCYLVHPSSLQTIKEYPNLHPEKVSGLHWSPIEPILATAGSDGAINLLSNPTHDADNGDNHSKITTLHGHQERINNVQFHPSGTVLASASSDLTWRLWDVSRGTELYFQEGHSDSVNTVSHHPDGSLLASAGNDSIIKLWDLRSGNLVLDLMKNGHVGSIHSLAWRNNGYHLASGGADSQLLVWDIRMMKKLSSVLAHKKLISCLKFSENGNVLLSSGYDGSLTMTSSDNWLIFKKFQTLDKIMALETKELRDTSDMITIYTGGWDRSIKLYNSNL